MAVSKYPPFSTWPAQIQAHYLSILENQGIHYTFQSGRQWNESTNLMPRPLYLGYTIRVFLYAGELEGINFITPFAYGVFTNAYSKLSNNGRELWNGNEKTTFSVQNREIYSIGMRVQDSSYFQYYRNDNYMGRSVGLSTSNITSHNQDWYLWMATSGQTVLSLHFSNETKVTVDISYQPFMKDVRTPPGTYVIYTLRAKQDVTIVWGSLDQADKPVTFQFDATVASGTAIVVTYRRTLQEHIVSSRFTDKPVVVKPYSLFDRIELRWAAALEVLHAQFVLPY